jgi:hypothetical protein
MLLAVSSKKWLAIVKLFPARESLVSDILAGDWKTANFFYSVFLSSDSFICVVLIACRCCKYMRNCVCRYPVCFLPLYLKVLTVTHRIDRVLGFFSSSPNCNPPPPHLQASVSPPPLVPGGRHTPLRKRGWGVPIRTRKQTLWYSLFLKFRLLEVHLIFYETHSAYSGLKEQ